jgi:hypothetical protein
MSQSERKLKISDLPRAQVLAALYNASAPSGAGILHYCHGFLSSPEAEQILKENPDLGERVDYLRGRRIKLDFTSSGWDSLPYEQLAGAGMASKVLEILRKTGQPDHPQIKQLHYRSLLQRRDQERWNLAHIRKLNQQVVAGLEEASQAGGQFLGLGWVGETHGVKAPIKANPVPWPALLLGVALLYSTFHINTLQNHLADLESSEERYQKALLHMRDIELESLKPLSGSGT